jgi:hypothetical protein
MKSLLLAVALTALAIPAHAQTRNKAVIVVTSGENARCQGENAQAVWVIIVRDGKGRIQRRYITSLDSFDMTSQNFCVILPITAPIGTQIIISGLLAGRGPLDGLSPSVTEQCFNAEAYSVGLSSEGAVGQLNPQDPNNIVNAQGYGLFWDETDTAAENTDKLTVVGCGEGVKCQMPKTVFNTDTGLTSNSGCEVLAPLS